MRWRSFLKKIGAYAVIMVMACGITASAELLVTQMNQYTVNGATLAEITISSEMDTQKRKVHLVNGEIKNPKKIIWLFHGYKPAGDPYHQSPKIFIENWGLIKLCKANDFILIAPDMGTSLYPLYDYNDEKRISDMRYLKELHNELVFKNHRSVPTALIGVSTGVEGAIKFSTLIDNIDSVVAISGTYDFFTLPEDSGEYRMHERVFGDNVRTWLSENPVEILRRSVRLRLYLFCEHNSIYHNQTLGVIDKRLPNLDIEEFLDLGKGFSHSWKYWGNKKVTKAVHDVLLK